MTTYSYDGTNYALMATPRMHTWPYAAQSRNARVYCMSDECYATSTGTLGSVLYLGGLPTGAVPLISVIWPIDSTDLSVGGDNWAGSTTGKLGTADTDDIFGDVADLQADAKPQVLAPAPNGSGGPYTTTLDLAFRTAVTPRLLTAADDVISTEGVALKILYTHGGRTY